MVTVRPFSSNQSGPSKMCFELKATNAVAFGPLKCFSPISSGLLFGKISRKEKSPKHTLLGPYWFEENGRTVTINSERYIAILDQFQGKQTQKLTQGQLILASFM